MAAIMFSQVGDSGGGREVQRQTDRQTDRQRETEIERVRVLGF